MPLSKTSPVSDSADCLNLSDFDLRLERYRIVQPKADQLLARSLSKYGQLAPVPAREVEALREPASERGSDPQPRDLLIDLDPKSIGIKSRR